MISSASRCLLAAAVVATVACSAPQMQTHNIGIPHIDPAPDSIVSGETLGLSLGFVPPPAAPEPSTTGSTRRLRAEHNGEVHGSATHGGVISPGGGAVNPNTGVRDPGGILGPLYAVFPQLLAPLTMASDPVHNSNVAISGVQHTPDGIFQA